MKKLVISIVLVNLLAACASEKPKDVQTSPDNASVAAKKAAAAKALDPLNDPASILAKRSVYYPLDVDVVQDADKPAVAAHAKYLADHANRKVRLEGNCDERGSNEYNLSLGQRRADGVKKMLELGGAKTGQVESTSYGEEMPKASGHDESSWSQNRRTDLRYAK
jgi:peptidoglycan-associated lipoprotein